MHVFPLALHASAPMLCIPKAKDAAARPPQAHATELGVASISLAASSSSSSKGHKAQPPLLAPQQPPPPHRQAAKNDLFPHADEVVIHAVRGWWVPALYLQCALLFGLCNLLLPSHALHVPLGMLWCLALFLHACSRSGVFFTLGMLLLALTPFLQALDDHLFYVFYLACFSAFCSGPGFWRENQGVVLVVLCAAWVGLAVCAAMLLLVGASGRGRRVIYVMGASFLALFIAMVCSRKLASVQYKVTGPLSWHSPHHADRV